MKNKILIVTTIVALIVISLFLILLPSISKDTAISSSITKDGYYIEKGLEKIALVVIPSVENYVRYNKSESTADRAVRLRDSFAQDSPALDIDRTNDIDPSINKIDVSVTSVVSCKYSISDYQCVQVMTDTKFYSDKYTYNETQSYWVSIVESDKSFKSFDIGMFD